MGQRFAGLVLAIALAAALVAADIPMPGFPTEYSTLVAANFGGDKGYTLTYFETRDNAGQMGFIGRNGDYNDRTLVVEGPTTDTVYFWEPDTPATGCKMQTLPSNSYRSSVDFFTTFEEGSTTFVGNSIVRDFNASQWYALANFNASGENYELTINYYWVLATPMNPLSVPVRITVDGVHTNQATGVTKQFNHFYDWVLFSNVPNTAWFTIPSGCSNTPFPDTVLPTVSTVVPAPDYLPFPTFSQAFQAVVEAKFDRAENHTSSNFLAGFVWDLDLPNGHEAVQGVSNRFNQTIVFNYNEGGYGTEYEFDADGCHSNFLTGRQFDPNVSPVKRLALGSIYGLFSGETDTSNAVYKGRLPSDQTVRGVVADHWDLSITKTIDNNYYVFDIDVYTFPQGWQFPGRPDITPGTNVPLRFTVSGTMRNNTSGVTRTFNAVLDVFRFADEALPQDAWNLGNQCMPPVPLAYSTTIEYTDHNVGFTLSFDEYHDDNLGMLRTDGRLESYDTVDIIDFAAATLKRLTAPATCTQYSLTSDQLNSLQPSYKLWENLSYNSTYAGQSTIRYINCDQWHRDLTFTYEGVYYEYHIDFYWSVAQSYPGGGNGGRGPPREIPREPVRFVFLQTINGLLSNFSIDYINFIVGDQEAIYFQTDRICVAGTPPVPQVAIPTSNTVKPMPLANTPFPALQTSFRLTLEAKLSGDTTSANAVMGGSWEADSVRHFERIDFDDPSTPDTNRTTIVWRYNDGPTGSVYSIDAQDMCTSRALQAGERSYLASARGGIIYDILTGALASNLSNAVFMGRYSVRNVMADYWQDTFLYTRQGRSYNVFVYIYFFPEGWQFPGVNPSYRVPMRIEIQGTSTFRGNTQNIHDLWDIFRFVGGQPPAADFEVQSQFGCMPPIPPQYHTQVAVNMFTYGTTFAFEETYDDSRQMLQTVGRFDQYDQVQVYNLTSGIVWSYNENDPTYACLQYALGPNQIANLRPSFELFSNIQQVIKFYGNSTQIRGINVDEFSSHREGDFNGTHYSVDFWMYWTQNSPRVARVPVMFCLDTKLTDSNGVVTENSIRVDYVDFIPAVNHPECFNVPNVCPMATRPDPDWVFPNTTWVQPLPPTTPPPYPSLPAQFRMFVEGKVNFNESVINVNAGQASAVEWFYDGPNAWERVEYDDPMNPDRDNTVYYYRFNEGEAGTVYHVYPNGTCQSQFIVPGSYNAESNLRRMRSGIIHRIFDGSIDTSKAGYTDPLYVRGVMADAWTLPVMISNRGVDYSLVVTVYFYPRGWSFPGRGLGENERIPMRVVAVGTATRNFGGFPGGGGGGNVGQAMPYTEQWDIFRTIFEPQQAAVFDPVIDGWCMPPIPTTYESEVIATISDKGYTLTYTEYADADLQLLRTDGRYTDWDFVTVFNMANNTVAVFNPYTDEEHPCQLYHLPTPFPFQLQSSMTFFQLVANAQPVFDGPVVIRSVPAYKFHVDVEYTYPDSNNVMYHSSYTYNIYWSRNNVESRVPMRAEMNGTTVNVANPSLNPVFSQHTYDWVNFKILKPEADVWTLPTACPTTPSFGDLPTITLPDSAQVSPQPSSQTMPVVAQNFQLILEGKYYNGAGPGDGNIDLNVFDIAWYRSDYESLDRIDELVVGNPYTDINIWRYGEGLNGALYVKNSTDGRCVHYTVPGGALGNNGNPLARTRSGGLYVLFSGGGRGDAQYQGRTTIRGVPADWWRISSVNIQRGTTTYQYTAEVYFYPVGWQFPGEVATTYRKVMRYVEYGNMVVNNVNIGSYFDQWDIFAMVPQNPYAAVFDPSVISCMPAIPTQYDVVVSANFKEKGYSVAYAEIYDEVRGFLRTDGRFNDITVADVYNLQTGQFCEYQPNFPDVGCAAYNLPTNYSIDMVGSTASFFRDYQQPRVDFVCREEVRGIPSDKFVTTINATFPDDLGHMTKYDLVLYYYWSTTYASGTGAIGAVRVPMRVELIGTATNLTTNMARSFDHVYDWSSFDVRPQQPNLFITPADCINRPLSELDTITLPTQSMVTPAPRVMAFPVMSKKFLLRMEGKLSYTVTDVPAQFEVTWFVDTQLGMQRVESAKAFAATSSSTIIVNTVDQIVNTFDDLGNCTSRAYVMGEKVTPLMQARQGGASIDDVMTGNVDLSRAVYVGRQSVRGVDCDTFVSQSVMTYNNMPYVTLITVYFYPDGWQFPGLTTDQYKVPVRVVLSGELPDDPANPMDVDYEDIFDFFQYVPIDPKLYQADIFNARCPYNGPPASPIVAPPPQDDKYSSSEIAAFIIVPLGILALIVMACVVYRVISRKETANRLRDDQGVEFDEHGQSVDKGADPNLVIRRNKGKRRDEDVEDGIHRRSRSEESSEIESDKGGAKVSPRSIDNKDKEPKKTEGAAKKEGAAAAPTRADDAAVVEKFKAKAAAASGAPATTTTSTTAAAAPTTSREAPKVAALPKPAQAEASRRGKGDDSEEEINVV